MNEEKRIIDEALKDVVGGHKSSVNDAPSDSCREIDGSVLTVAGLREKCVNCDGHDLDVIKVWLTDSNRCADAQECRKCNAIWLI